MLDNIRVYKKVNQFKRKKNLNILSFENPKVCKIGPDLC